MMLYLINLIILLKLHHIATVSTNLSEISKTQDAQCNGVVFQDVYYDKELIIENYEKPYSLTIHKYSGFIFFSHTIGNGTFIDFAITTCHLIRKKCRRIPGITGGYAISHDSVKDDIYFGGHEGIYIYNFKTRSADFFAEAGESVWAIFINADFYYIQYPTQTLRVRQNHKFVPVEKTKNVEVDNFLISSSDDVYYSNRSALFKIITTEADPMILNDDIIIRQITEDSFGDVYFAAADGIYIEDKPYLRLAKLANIDQVFGLTFDDFDRVVYSDANSINRLTISANAKQCYQAKNVLRGRPRSLNEFIDI